MRRQSTQHPLSPELQSEVASLQMLANRANARRVEAHLGKGSQWGPPKVLDTNRLRRQGVDMDMYEKVGGWHWCRGHGAWLRRSGEQSERAHVEGMGLG